MTRASPRVPQAERGIRYLEAPLTGGANLLKAGKMTVPPRAPSNSSHHTSSHRTSSHPISSHPGIDTHRSRDLRRRAHAPIGITGVHGWRPFGVRGLDPVAGVLHRDSAADGRPRCRPVPALPCPAPACRPRRYAPACCHAHGAGVCTWRSARMQIATRTVLPAEECSDAPSFSRSGLLDLRDCYIVAPCETAI